jgi:serine/threonine-protein kinase RsbW
MGKPAISGNSITVPSDLKYLVDVDNFVEGLLREWGLDESTVADIAISVSELVNNAVEHGNDPPAGGDGERLVKVTVGRLANTVKVSVSDRGHGFDPTEIDDPLADENLLKAAGRGIFIVRNLMDEVDIKTTPDGTVVTITKNL